MFLPLPAPGLLAEMPLAEKPAALAGVAAAAAPQHAQFTGGVAHAHDVQRAGEGDLEGMPCTPWGTTMWILEDAHKWLH